MVVFSSSAFRQLSKLDKNVQKRITDKLGFYLSQDDPLDFAERLTDHQFGDWRYRVGDHRVIFDAERGKIVILKIGHRKNIY